MAEPFLLTRDLTRPFPAPEWPAGIAVAPFSATLAPKVYALMKLAYANGGGSMPTVFDAWWAATRHDAEFDAGLCVAAMAGSEPVGFALCWTASFVKDLVVHPEWHRKGIGTALLLEAFRRLAGRGRTTVSLKVESDNMEARRLYARLGFRKG